MTSKKYQDKDWLYQKYWGEGLSDRDIARDCHISSSLVWYWKDKLKIPSRDRCEAIKKKGCTLRARIVIKKHCKNCNKLFSLKLNAYLKGRKFCSAKCQREALHRNIFGINNPNYGNGDKVKGNKNGRWRGGISFEPYGLEFNSKLKAYIRKRDDYQCQECGVKENGKAHDCHHIDYNKENNKPENLIALCKCCHSKTNGNREYWQNRFEFYINAVIVGGSANIGVTRQGSSTPQPSLHISNKEDIWSKFKLGEQFW